MKVRFKATPLYRPVEARCDPVAAVPAASVDARPRRRHPVGHAAAMLGAGAVLWGCAQAPQTPPSPVWRIAPATVSENTGSSVAAGYLALARRYEKEARYAQAGDAYNMALETGNDDAQVLDGVGVALAGHGQMARAIKALRRAAALEPTNAAILNNLGYALLLSERSDEAIAYFRLALTIEPGHRRAAENLARLVPAPTAVAAAVPVPAAPTAPSVPEAPPVTLEAVQRPAEPKADRPVATATEKATDKVVAPRRIAGLRIEYINANGGTGVAQRMRRWLRSQGVAGGAVANRRKLSSVTIVEYRADRAELAREIVSRLPWAVATAVAPNNRMRADLRVVIGRDARLAPHCVTLRVCRPGVQQVMASAGALATSRP